MFLRIRKFAELLNRFCHLVILLFIGGLYAFYATGAVSYDQTLNPRLFYTSVNIMMVVCGGVILTGIIKLKSLSSVFNNVIFAIMYFVALVASSYVLRIPYPFKYLQLPNDREIIFAANNVFTNAGFSLFQARNHSTIFYTRVTDRDVYISDTSDPDTVSLVYKKTNKSILIKDGQYYTDCFMTRGADIIPCNGIDKNSLEDRSTAIDQLYNLGN